jgi:hypothetical protein
LKSPAGIDTARINELIGRESIIRRSDKRGGFVP